jgi:putative hydrolase
MFSLKYQQARTGYSVKGFPMSTYENHQFDRFLNLKWADTNCDLHLHTSRTDGRADIGAIMRRAVGQGLSRIAFTEHVRRDTTWFQEFAHEVRAGREAYPNLEVLVGCEAKALDMRGSLDATDEILAECDIVLGSVHRFPDTEGGYLDFSALSQEQFAHIEFELALGLLEAAPIDVLAHPGGMHFRWHSDLPSDIMREILRKSLDRGIAVEINSSNLGDFDAFLRLCAEVNPYVSIGSDMHRLEELGECRDRLRAQAKGVIWK